MKHGELNAIWQDLNAIVERVEQIKGIDARSIIAHISMAQCEMENMIETDC